ncbi:hypothetical protein G0U57_000972, partial [Chelydra serpentina]
QCHPAPLPFCPGETHLCSQPSPTGLQRPPPSVTSSRSAGRCSFNCRRRCVMERCLRGPFWSPTRGPATGCIILRGRPGATSAGRWGMSGGTVPWPGKEECPGPPNSGRAQAPSSPAPLAAQYQELPLLLPNLSLVGRNPFFFCAKS